MVRVIGIWNWILVSAYAGTHGYRDGVYSCHGIWIFDGAICYGNTSAICGFVWSDACQSDDLGSRDADEILSWIWI